MYRRLNPDKIITTLEQLERRIEERFPGAGLTKVCAELTTAAREAGTRALRLARPNVVLRTVTALIVALGGAGLLYIARLINVQSANTELFGMLQGIEATVNLLIVVGAAVLFLVTLEARAKRRQALVSLYELRAIVHVVDMHQLTKDPGHVLRAGVDTLSSPKRITNPADLVRYLDYCSEMLSLASKVGALYAQSTIDAQVIETVSDLERLTSTLSQKIWQKINIVERGHKGVTPATAAGTL
jgi:hypothetical protein